MNYWQLIVTYDPSATKTWQYSWVEFTSAGPAGAGTGRGAHFNGALGDKWAFRMNDNSGNMSRVGDTTITATGRSYNSKDSPASPFGNTPGGISTTGNVTTVTGGSLGGGSVSSQRWFDAKTGDLNIEGSWTFEISGSAEISGETTPFDIDPGMCVGQHCPP